LRAELGRRLQIFTTQFVYDESIERGVHMSRLIDEVTREYQQEDVAEAEGDKKEEQE